MYILSLQQKHTQQIFRNKCAHFLSVRNRNENADIKMQSVNVDFLVNRLRDTRLSLLFLFYQKNRMFVLQSNFLLMLLENLNEFCLFFGNTVFTLKSKDAIFSLLLDR